MKHRVAFGFGAGLALVCFACAKTNDQATLSDASSPAAADAAVASAAIDAGAAADAGDPAVAVVYAWNDALDKQNIDALSRLYAPRVKFYGHVMTHDALVAEKRRAIVGSTFHQWIVTPPKIGPNPDGSLRATFVKKWTLAAHDKQVTAHLSLVTADGGALLISEETDDPSIALAAKEGGKACVKVVDDTVRALPEVKKQLDDVKKELPKYPDRALGGVGPLDEDDGGFTAGIGVQQPERYEAIVWYTVTKDGKLSVMVMGSDVSVPAAKLAAVETSCKK